MKSEDPQAARLGRALMAARAERGLKRRDLADLADLSYPYLSEIENGRKQPSVGKLQALAVALGLTPAELLGRAEKLPQDRHHVTESFEERSALMTMSTFTGSPAVLDDEAVESISRSVAETIQSKLGPWLQAEIARLVRDEISRAKGDTP